MQKVRSLGRVVRACVSDDIGPSSGKSEWCKLAVDGATPESSDNRKAISASSCQHELVKEEEKEWRHDLPNCPNPALPWLFLR